MALISCEVLGSCCFSCFFLPIPHAVPGWCFLALCILQTAWHKGISKDLSWGFKALLKFLFISGCVLNSSFPSELAISFQPAECQLLSQQQRVTSVSPDACQQPLTCHFFIPHTSNAWRDQGYSFPLPPRHKAPKEPKVCGVHNHRSWNLKQSRLPRSHLP